VEEILEKTWAKLKESIEALFANEFRVEVKDVFYVRVGTYRIEVEVSAVTQR
jgi:hypothetical protein